MFIDCFFFFLQRKGDNLLSKQRLLVILGLVFDGESQSRLRTGLTVILLILGVLRHSLKVK
jgi:hypothetical protein